MDTAAANTHAILSRLGAPIRVAALSDWRALADMRTAASLSIGIYSIREASGREADRAEAVIAGRRDAAAVLASAPWSTAA